MLLSADCSARAPSVGPRAAGIRIPQGIAGIPPAASLFSSIGPLISGLLLHRRVVLRLSGEIAPPAPDVGTTAYSTARSIPRSTPAVQNFSILTSHNHRKESPRPSLRRIPPLAPPTIHRWMQPNRPAQAQIAPSMGRVCSSATPWPTAGEDVVPKPWASCRAPQSSAIPISPTILNHPEPSRTIPNHPESPRIIPDHPESSRIIPNHPESSRITPNHPESPRITPNHPESSRIIPNHPESPRITPNHPGFSPPFPPRLSSPLPAFLRQSPADVAAMTKNRGLSVSTTDSPDLRVLRSRMGKPRGQRHKNEKSWDVTVPFVSPAGKRL